MEKKYLRNILIGASAIAGVFCATQVEAAISEENKCYQYLSFSKSGSSTSLGESDIKDLYGGKLKHRAIGCHVSTKHTVAGHCNHLTGWYSAHKLDKMGRSDHYNLTNCKSVD